MVFGKVTSKYQKNHKKLDCVGCWWSARSRIEFFFSLLIYENVFHFDRFVEAVNVQLFIYISRNIDVSISLLLLWRKKK